MHLYSISAYVDQIVDQLDEWSQQTLRKIKADQLHALHSSWGRAIRNEFKLWQPDHPLTKNWHDHPENRNMLNGVDCSADHPDAISTRIMEGVWKKVNA